MAGFLSDTHPDLLVQQLAVGGAQSHSLIGRLGFVALHVVHEPEKNLPIAVT